VGIVHSNFGDDRRGIAGFNALFVGSVLAMISELLAARESRGIEERDVIP